MQDSTLPQEHNSVLRPTLFSTVSSYHSAVSPSRLQTCSTLLVASFVRPFRKENYIQVYCTILRSTHCPPPTRTCTAGFAARSAFVRHPPCCLWQQGCGGIPRRQIIRLRETRRQLSRHKLPWKCFHDRPSKCPRLTDCDQHDDAFSKEAPQRHPTSSWLATNPIKFSIWNAAASSPCYFLFSFFAPPAFELLFSAASSAKKCWSVPRRRSRGTLPARSPRRRLLQVQPRRDLRGNQL